MANCKFYASYILISGLLFVHSGKVRAQAKSAAASTSAPGASGSTTLTPQTGFVYYLKYQQHIQYKAVTPFTFYLTRSDLSKYWPDSTWMVLKDTSHSPQQVIVTLNYQRRPHKQMNSDPLSFTDYDATDYGTSSHPLTDTGHKTHTIDLDTLIIVNLTMADSIPRYWFANRQDWTTLSRLKVALTQDTDLITARIAYTNFDSIGPRHSACITNKNYKGQIPPGLGLYKDEAISNTIASLDSGFWRGIDNYSHTPDSDKDISFAHLTEGFTHYRGKYLGDLFMAQLSKRKGGLTNHQIDSTNNALTKDYNSYYRAQDTLEQLYAALSRSKKLELDSLRQEMLMADTLQERPGAQVRFLQRLLGIQVVRRPGHPGLPYMALDEMPNNLNDPLIPEMAIPISNTDSAANFFFKIDHKNFVNQPVLYQRFHFGAWDYGTLTIPYRYRFEPKHARLFNQSGKDSVVNATSEGDATLSIAGYLGRKWGGTRFYDDVTMTKNMFSVETSVFMGPTLIPLSAANINISSKYTGIKTNYVYSGPANIIAWSVGAGAVAEWHTINFGFFGGWDFPLTANTGWVYGHKIWIGFGIGVNLGMFNSGHSIN